MGTLHLKDIGSIQNEVSATNTINQNSRSIEESVRGLLPKDGSESFLGTLDMNSHRIMNLPAAVAGTEPLRLAEGQGILTGAQASAAAAAASASAAATSASNASTSASAASTSASAASTSASAASTSASSASTSASAAAASAALAANNVISFMIFDPTTDVVIGDTAGIFWRVPSSLNGYNLTGVAACVRTAGTTGTTDIQISRKRSGASVDMLSTKITIDSTEIDTLTAATPAVINLSNDDVNTGDQITIDVDAVSTTAPKGLIVELTFHA